MKIAFDVDVLRNRWISTVWSIRWRTGDINILNSLRIRGSIRSISIRYFQKNVNRNTDRLLKRLALRFRPLSWCIAGLVRRRNRDSFAVANWKRMIRSPEDMGVKVINTELSGDPNQQEICNGMWFRSMEELLPLIEREGIRVEIQSHPYDFCELNNETCDMVKSFRSPNLGYVYSSPHGFFYDEGQRRCAVHAEICGR